MRKSYSVRLNLSHDEGDEIKRICAAEERSQAEVLSRLVRDGLYQRRKASASTARLVAVLRGEAAE
jgi:hypothetical protein